MPTTLRCPRRPLLPAILCALCASAFAAIASQPEPHVPQRRQIPVTITLTPAPPAPPAATFTEAEPLLLDVTITNNLPGPIDFSGFGTQMTDWNAEAASISLVDIRRGDDIRNRFLHAPKVTPPPHIAGRSRRIINPGQSLTIRIDARKWQLRDHWIPGRYQVNVKVGNLRLDDFTQAIIMSEMVEFEIAKSK